MTMDDYSKIYIKPWSNTCKKKERKKNKRTGCQKRWQKSRGWRGAGRMAAQQKEAGSEASKLELQLTTMPSLARAPYRDELLLETRPWKTSSAPRCYLDGSGSEPWRSSRRKAMAAWSLHPPWYPIRHSLFLPPRPPTSGRLSTPPPLVPLLCCSLVQSRSRCLVSCFQQRTCFHQRCCMVGGSCHRLGMCYCQPCKRNPCWVAGAQPKPQPHRNTHQDEAFPLERLEGMPASHVSVAQLQESSCHKQGSLDVLVPAKEIKKHI